MKVWTRFEGNIWNLEDFVIRELASKNITRISKQRERYKISIKPKKNEWSFLSYTILMQQRENFVNLIFNVGLSGETLVAMFFYYLVAIIIPTMGLCGGFINLFVFLLLLLTIIPVHYIVLRYSKRELSEIKKMVKNIKDNYLASLPKVE